MKGKKYYFILTGLLLIGITAIYFFRQQQEKQYLEFEAFEIASVEARVNKLYSEDKTDISENIPAEELDEISELLNDLGTKEFSPKNEERLAIVDEEFQMAKEMDKLQININDLFLDREIIDENISVSKVEQLEKKIQIFQDKVVYYDRNAASLDSAKQQVGDIEVAVAFIESLFEDEFLRSDVTRENEEEAHVLVDKINNEKVRERLLAQLETVNLALNEMEEALALEAALAEEADPLEFEEEAFEETYEASSDSTWSPNNSDSTWTPSPSQTSDVPDNTPDEPSTGDSGEVEEEEVPTPDPAPVPEPDPTPEPEPETETSPIEEETDSDEGE